MLFSMDKEGQNAVFLFFFLFTATSVSGTFGRNKRSASLQQKNMHAKYRDFENVLGSEKYFEFVGVKRLRDV